VFYRIRPTACNPPVFRPPANISGRPPYDRNLPARCGWDLVVVLVIRVLPTMRARPSPAKGPAARRLRSKTPVRHRDRAARQAAGGRGKRARVSKQKTYEDRDKAFPCAYCQSIRNVEDNRPDQRSPNSPSNPLCCVATTLTKYT